jgi:hypothetical protein
VRFSVRFTVAINDLANFALPRQIRAKIVSRENKRVYESDTFAAKNILAN